MDISDINNIANRKRLNSEVENLRGRVTSEAKKIIKIKVAQDTAYWELKEKFEQLEINHEKLQQNITELQTQYETVSGQYQDEHRCRHETLNKLNNTRKVCDILNKYCDNLKHTFDECKADRESLTEAFQKSGEMVRDIKLKFEQKEANYELIIQNLEEKVKSTSDQQIQLVQYLKEANQQLDSQLCTTKAELATALAQRNELGTALNNMGKKLDQYKNEGEKKDNALSSLQVDMKRQVQEHNIQIGDLKNEMANLQNEKKELTEAKASLEETLMNREALNKTICDEKHLLLEKLTVAEEKRSIAEKERSIALGKVNILEVELESASIKCNQLSENVEENNKLEIAIKDMEQMLVQYKQEIETLKSQQHLSLEKLAVAEEKRSIAEKERSTVLGKVNVLEVELESASIKCNQLSENVKEKNKLEITVKYMEQMLVQYKQEIDTLKSQLSTQQAEKSDLVSALNTAVNVTKSKMAKIEEITEIKRTYEKKLAERKIELMSLQETHESKIKELSNLITNYEKDLTSKVAENKELMTEVKNEIDIRSKLENNLQKLQKECDKERETAKQFALSNRNKENEISEKTKTISEMTTEKTRLYEKIQTMQNTINNLEQELNTRNVPSRDTQVPPVIDDNAVVFPPAPQRKEVKRRFDALSRGEWLPPLDSISSTKKRRNEDKYTLQEASGPRMETSKVEPASLTQIREEPKPKERRFFKTKRADREKLW